MFNFLQEIEKDAKKKKILSISKQDTSIKEGYLYSIIQVRQINDASINRRESFVLQLLSASNPYNTKYVIVAEKDIPLFIALLDTNYFAFKADFDLYYGHCSENYYRIIFYSQLSLDSYNSALCSIEKDMIKRWVSTPNPYLERTMYNNRFQTIIKNINEAISNIRNKQYDIFIDKENNKIREINIAILDLHNLEGNSYGY